jgi:hypothetical protein
MFRLVTLLGFAALTLAVVAANAASREPSQPTGDDSSRNTNDPTNSRLPNWRAKLSFHAPFSLN